MTDPIRYRKDDEGNRYKVVMNEGFEGYIGRWTTACSGCYESTDGFPTGDIGGGCDECGYTGKRRWSMWVPFDITAWHKHMVEQEHLLEQESEAG